MPAKGVLGRWKGGKGGRVYCKSAAVSFARATLSCPVLRCAAFLLPTDLILKSFSAFTQIKMMTTLAKRQLCNSNIDIDRER